MYTFYNVATVGSVLAVGISLASPLLKVDKRRESGVNSPLFPLSIQYPVPLPLLSSSSCIVDRSFCILSCQAGCITSCDAGALILALKINEFSYTKVNPKLFSLLSSDNCQDYGSNRNTHSAYFMKNKEF